MELAVKILVWFVIVCEALSIVTAFRFIVIPSAANAGRRILPFTISVIIAAIALLVAFNLLEVLTTQTASPITSAFLAVVVLLFSFGAQYLTEMIFRK